MTTYAPAGELERITTATSSLLDSAARLTDDDVAKPSLLAGWSRGHVLTHLARNADALCNLLEGARAGVERPAYPSQQVRDADIESGAGRGIAEQIADIRLSHQRFLDTVALLTADDWEATVRRKTMSVPARLVPWIRLGELEIHHVDLGVAYTPAHWSADFITRQLETIVRDFEGRQDVPALRLVAEDTHDDLSVHDGERDVVTVRGPGAALLAWLLGRSNGDGLVTQPHGALPTIPTWM